MEVDTWVRNGYVILRYDQTIGKGIYFSHNGEVGSGLGHLEIGIITGAGETAYQQGNSYVLYRTNRLRDIAPGYTSTATECQYFTFGVEGFDIYAKYGGVEFLRFK